MKNTKNSKILFCIIIIVVFIASASFTYAFFSAGMADQNPNGQTVTAGILSLTYVDGNQINLNMIKPGSHASKIFNVTNSGTYDTYYKIGWEYLLNEILNNELVYSYTCKSYINYGLETQEEYGTCDNKLSTPVGVDVNSTLANNILIDIGITHVYELSIDFLEMSSEQNYNQGKNMNGAINIFESNESLNIRGIVTDADDNPISGAIVEFHSALRKASTDEFGKYEIIGVETGNHTITIKNSNNEVIGTDNVIVSSGENATIENKQINWDKTSNIKYLKIEVDNSQISSYEIIDYILVNLDSNGGVLSTFTKNVLYNDSYGQLPTPTKVGNSFLGWYDKNEGGNEIALFTINRKTYEHTLYARWQINTSTLVIDPINGYWNDSSSVQTFTQSYNTTLNIPIPTRTGYIFNGWVRENNNGTISSLVSDAIYTFGTSASETDKITASWKKAYSINNLIQNGDFESDSMIWVDEYNTTFKISTNCSYSGQKALHLWTTDTSLLEGYIATTSYFTYTSGHVYYSTMVFEGPDVHTQIYFPYVYPYPQSYASSNNFQWTKNSLYVLARNDIASGQYNLRLDIDNIGLSKDVCIDDLILVDLTTSFGVGNEPNLEWCDANIPYFAGTMIVYK